MILGGTALWAKYTPSSSKYTNGVSAYTLSITRTGVFLVTTEGPPKKIKLHLEQGLPMGNKNVIMRRNNYTAFKVLIPTGTNGRDN